MKHIDLSRGRITVQVNQQHSHWALDDLLDFAERINPKRAFLFVSKVLETYSCYTLCHAA
jgi:hypothetical protein